MLPGAASSSMLESWMEAHLQQVMTHKMCEGVATGYSRDEQSRLICRGSS